MFRRSSNVVAVTTPESRAEALLDELCVRYGYCLSANKQQALLAHVPEDADAFVAAVLDAEGLDPTCLDKGAYQELMGVVRHWLFDDGHGRAGPLRADAQLCLPGASGDRMLKRPDNSASQPTSRAGHRRLRADLRRDWARR